ncbi:MULTISPECIES: acetolactate synthase small subunit [Hyunsoonleella]|uniref:Acetolactate synthase small subunit n=2 Tax=Hyunsoonleella TaxID=1080193 RepID=A0A923HBJ0_9FLAO|nr:acetolactate synthase small subunit [Hyunsoonleella aquatilis]MBC3758051.1 acetolactate synthase small subunit [Hyunsoonleella aquatilis]
MSQDIKTFTISVYTENNIGLLNRISAIFQRRHINIESLTTSQSEIKDVNRFVIVVKITEDQAIKVVRQIEKQVETIRAYYHTNEETIFTENCMFKIRSELLFEEPQIQNIIKDSESRIVTVNREFFVLESTGRRHEIEKLREKLDAFGIMQFVRSGRIAVTKDEMKVSEILEEFRNQ